VLLRIGTLSAIALGSLLGGGSTFVADALQKDAGRFVGWDLR
jgi:hypothetical protein